MTTITIACRKGGNGKSTSALNLACAYGQAGKRVLLVDLDDQRNTSSAIEASEDEGLSIAEVLTDPAIPIDRAVAPTGWKGVSLLRSSKNLSGVIRELDGEVGSHLVLKERLAEAGGYDLCLIDTGPSLNILVVSALCASRWLFIPLSSKVFSLSGLGQTMEAFGKVRGRVNPDLSVLGIAFVIHDARSNLSREVVGKVGESYPDLLCTSVINQNIKIEQAQVLKQSILSYAPEDRGAIQYRDLAEELLTRMAGR